MKKVRETILTILGDENADDVLSLASYTLQASRLKGRRATVGAAQGDAASVVLFGPTVIANASLSTESTQMNVALTRAIDLFLLIVPRQKYAREIKPVLKPCLLYTSPSPRDVEESRMPSSA